MCYFIYYLHVRIKQGILIENVDENSTIIANVLSGVVHDGQLSTRGNEEYLPRVSFYGNRIHIYLSKSKVRKKIAQDSKRLGRWGDCIRTQYFLSILALRAEPLGFCFKKNVLIRLLLRYLVFMAE